MADTVKKSRIVSDDCLSSFSDEITEDTSLQDIINEEFNQRLKNCMKNEPIEANSEHIALTYEVGEVVLKNGNSLEHNGDLTNLTTKKSSTNVDLESEQVLKEDLTQLGLNGNEINISSDLSPENGVKINQSNDSIDKNSDQNDPKLDLTSEIDSFLDLTSKSQENIDLTSKIDQYVDLTSKIDQDLNFSTSEEDILCPKGQKSDQSFDLSSNTSNSSTSVNIGSKSSTSTVIDAMLPTVPNEISPETDTSDSFINNENPSPEDEMETPFDNITVTDVDSENLNAKDRFLSTVSDIETDLNLKMSTVKDRMFLSTDSACLLFTQTVIQSPMLTPTDENYDFLQALRQNDTNLSNTVSPDISPVKENVEVENSPDRAIENISENTSENTLENSPVTPSKVSTQDGAFEKSPETEMSPSRDISSPNKEIISDTSELKEEKLLGSFENLTTLSPLKASDAEILRSPQDFQINSEKINSEKIENIANVSDEKLSDTSDYEKVEMSPTEHNTSDEFVNVEKNNEFVSVDEKIERIDQIADGLKELTSKFIQIEMSECDGEFLSRNISITVEDTDAETEKLSESCENIEKITETNVIYEKNESKSVEKSINIIETETVEQIIDVEVSQVNDVIENSSDVSREISEAINDEEKSHSKVSEISKFFTSETQETKTPSPLLETFENIKKTKEFFEKSPDTENFIPKSCNLVKKLEEIEDCTNTVCLNSFSTSTTSITSESTFVETKTESNSGQEKVLKKKKSKKSKKDNEKENISVCDNNSTNDDDNLSHVSVKSLCRSFSDLTCIGSKSDTRLTTKHTYGRTKSMSDIRKDDTNKENVFSHVSVKTLRECFNNLINRTNSCLERDLATNLRTKIAPKSSNRIEQLKSSFSKFDALSKKTIHVRSADSGKAQEKFNGSTPADTSNCKACSKQVFQMEQVKAEKNIWHKNCFRCNECGKQLNVDTYQSNEGVLYCKPHFRALFTPKAVEEEQQPIRPRKHEMIIRENQPMELPADVVRASDKPDLGLEELQNLNVKERFQVFENHENQENSLERTPSTVNVKRSPSILSKLAKFQSKGMDIGVADDSLNGVPVEESSSESEEEEDDIEGEDADLIRAKRAQREKPLHFNNMSDIMSKWESGNQMTKEERREERKQEIQSIRSRLFMGKQGKMKEMYQQAVAESESGVNVKKQNPLDSEITESTRSIKEKFERGEALTKDEQQKLKELEEDKSVFESGISKKSRSIFLELDANASKPPLLTPVSPVKPSTEVRRAREAYLNRTASEDVVKASDHVDDVIVKTADISNKFKFFETYKEPEKQRKAFRITPPRDGAEKGSSPDREVYRDPEVVRSAEQVDDSEVVQKSHTATKMLSIFRQMEENLTKEHVPAGPKPLKRFTPPPEPTREESSSGEEESESEVDEEESDHEDRKMDEDLIEAQKAARAKQLRAKFEKWEASEIQREQNNSSVNLAEELGDGESQIESAKSLRARFESMRETSSDKERTPRVKVNRFV